MFKLIIAFAALVVCSGAWADLIEQDRKYYHETSICAGLYAYAEDETNRSTATKKEAQRQGMLLMSKELIWEAGRFFQVGYEWAVASMARNNFEREYKRRALGIVEHDCYRFAPD